MMHHPCPINYHDCIPGCKYWKSGKCEIMTRCESIIQNHFISDLLIWRENEYNSMKMPNFTWLKEGEANVIWYRETQHLKKLRGDKT